MIAFALESSSTLEKKPYSVHTPLVKRAATPISVAVVVCISWEGPYKTMQQLCRVKKEVECPLHINAIG